MPLTGRFTFRRSIGGRIILQVEEEYRSMWSLSRNRPLKKRWRDANLMDLAAPEVKQAFAAAIRSVTKAGFAVDAPRSAVSWRAGAYVAPWVCARLARLGDRPRP